VEAKARDYRFKVTTVHGQDDDVDGASSAGVGHLD
jgi:hypothetical protein